MLSTVLYYELAMKVPIPVGITVYLLTWGLGHLRCLVISHFARLYLESNWWAPSLYDTCLERAYVSSDVKVTAACIH